MGISNLQRRELSYRLRDFLAFRYPPSDKQFVHLANAEEILRELEAWGFELNAVGITLNAPTAEGKGFGISPDGATHSSSPVRRKDDGLEERSDGWDGLR